MLGPQEKILRKISSTTSMNDLNVMRRNIEHMYESSHYNLSHESLLANLERFIKSVNTMAHTVMIPSRLMDLQVDEIALSDKLLADDPSMPPTIVKSPDVVDEDTSSISSCDSSFDQMSNLSYSNKNTSNDHHRNNQSPVASKHTLSSPVSQIDHSNRLDMYTVYKMLVSARNDLVWASTLEEEETPAFTCGDGEEFDTHAHSQHILMVKFKHHLEALNQVTSQFADLAEVLTSKYECHENLQ